MNKDKIENTNLDRFFGSFVVGDPAECWEWGGIRVSGYGRFNVGPRCLRAHRVMAEMVTPGGIPDKMCVCHACDNPACVNPNHLYLGTHQDNIRDCTQKGRHNPPIGTDHHGAILCNQDVVIIRGLLFSGVRQRIIAGWFDVSAATISHINTKRKWAHVV